jgi:hypothetical protein
MGITIKTDSKPRDLFSLAEFSPELQPQIREDFDFLDDIENDSCFFSYRGALHHLSEFAPVNADLQSPFYGWHAVEADTHWSGTLVKILDSGRIVVGRYVS